MARKHKSKEIIGKLREAVIVLAQGGTVAVVYRRIGVTVQSYYGCQMRHQMSPNACKQAVSDLHTGLRLVSAIGRSTYERAVANERGDRLE